MFVAGRVASPNSFCTPLLFICSVHGRTRAVLLTLREAHNFDRSQILNLYRSEYSWMSSVCRRANGLLLCSFEGWDHVTELSARPLRATCSYTLRTAIHFLALGQPQGLETLFASCADRTVRSFRLMASDSAEELAQVALTDPWQVLWLPDRELLCVTERDSKKGAKKVSVFSVGSNGSLQQSHTALSADLQMNITCWCLSKKNVACCFEGKKKELVELEVL